jgi:hypothetical protein
MVPHRRASARIADPMSSIAALLGKCETMNRPVRNDESFARGTIHRFASDKIKSQSAHRPR